MNDAALPPMLERPLRDLDAWTAWLRAAPIPVLAYTAASIDELVDHEDAVDARLLAETIGDDPLATLRLLVHVAALRGGRDTGQAETVTAALVLLGVTPFFRAFTGLPTVEARLADHPEALAGFQRVLRRSQRAATFALGFAVHRADPDAPVIHEAAQLHDFAEMLLWCHAPALMLEIARRQAAEPTLRSAVAQRDVLGIELADLQHALMVAWRLPPLLVKLDDDRHADTPPVRCVLLAQRLARHTARGWDDPALPDDVSDIAQLLQLGPEPTRRLLLSLDA
ncbi:HDOD domain-containing protein [Azohydromonas sediminis]|uniref:HDOD domain-containing protein n=1 Tax=Azohydromonas sediminis TaxID=2259674 RepID=UPI001F3FE6CD|nr:HDOD domain-containing protein [Azohydromonas sediminis]